MVHGVKSKKRSAIWQEKKEAHQFFFGGFGGFFCLWVFFGSWWVLVFFLVAEKGSLNLAFLLLFLLKQKKFLSA